MTGRPAGERGVDSPDPWVADHIRRLVATGGQAREGVDDLLLTTRGRRSGLLRRTALVYVRDGGRWIVTGSNRGADRHPAWYLNLVAEPRVTVEIGGQAFAARARTATPAEKPRLWASMVAAMPSYRAYQEGTAREIPVVIIERVGDAG
ncbi:nitroreductase [Embleya scabrispora]|uniref:Nitroreductase n=1 Tax=Embleya scabrispora TaxID=159449 RepID=A0A1T3NTQ8_9ACTN|nr:nitroreductase/quinone reductase family protein [Embleya scabrispora]OPC80062.1 nitroreductase [Embleya scabrispora]